MTCLKEHVFKKYIIEYMSRKIDIRDTRYIWVFKPVYAMALSQIRKSKDKAMGPRMSSVQCCKYHQ